MACPLHYRRNGFIAIPRKAVARTCYEFECRPLVSAPSLFFAIRVYRGRVTCTRTTVKRIDHVCRFYRFGSLVCNPYAAFILQCATIELNVFVANVEGTIYREIITFACFSTQFNVEILASPLHYRRNGFIAIPRKTVARTCYEFECRPLVSVPSLFLAIRVYRGRVTCTRATVKRIDGVRRGDHFGFFGFFGRFYAVGFPSRARPLQLTVNDNLCLQFVAYERAVNRKDIPFVCTIFKCDVKFRIGLHQFRWRDYFAVQLDPFAFCERKIVLVVIEIKRITGKTANAEIIRIAIYAYKAVECVRQMTDPFNMAASPTEV